MEFREGSIIAAVSGGIGMLAAWFKLRERSDSNAAEIAEIKAQVARAVYADQCEACRRMTAQRQESTEAHLAEIRGAISELRGDVKHLISTVAEIGGRLRGGAHD